MSSKTEFSPHFTNGVLARTVWCIHNRARSVRLFGCGGLGSLALTLTVTGVNRWPGWRHGLIIRDIYHYNKKYYNDSKYRQRAFLSCFHLYSEIYTYIASKAISSGEIHRRVDINDCRVISTPTGRRMDTVSFTPSWERTKYGQHTYSWNGCVVIFITIWWPFDQYDKKWSSEVKVQYLRLTTRIKQYL